MQILLPCLLTAEFSALLSYLVQMWCMRLAICMLLKINNVQFAKFANSRNIREIGWHLMSLGGEMRFLDFLESEFIDFLRPDLRFQRGGWHIKPRCRP